MSGAAPTEPMFPPGFNLGTTFGALEVSTILSSILFGVVTTQTYSYHRNFPNDSIWTKCVVDVLWLVELAQTICTIQYLYFWTITGYANPLFLAKAPPTLGLGVLFYGICVVLVQGYFIYRLFKVTSTVSGTEASTPLLVRIIPIPLVAVLTARFGVIVAGSAEAFRLPFYQPFVAKYRMLIVASQVLGTVTDITITLTLVFNLRRRRADMIQSTVVIIDKLILWAIETGALTSIVGIAILISLFTMENNFIWLALLMILPKIFSNTLLANLNSRTQLRSMRGTHIIASNDTPNAPIINSYSKTGPSYQFQDGSNLDMKMNIFKTTVVSESIDV